MSNLLKKHSLKTVQPYLLDENVLILSHEGDIFFAQMLVPTTSLRNPWVLHAARFSEETG
jgi:hypothetical protein